MSVSQPLDAANIPVIKMPETTRSLDARRKSKFYSVLFYILAVPTVIFPPVAVFFLVMGWKQKKKSLPIVKVACPHCKGNRDVQIISDKMVVKCQICSNVFYLNSTGQ